MKNTNIRHLYGGHTKAEYISAGSLSPWCSMDEPGPHGHLQRQFCCYPHLADENTEARKGGWDASPRVPTLLVGRDGTGAPDAGSVTASSATGAPHPSGVCNQEVPAPCSPSLSHYPEDNKKITSVVVNRSLFLDITARARMAVT